MISQHASDTELRLLLTDETAANTESVELHLELCPICRERLESLAPAVNCRPHQEESTGASDSPHDDAWEQRIVAMLLAKQPHRVVLPDSNLPICKPGDVLRGRVHEYRISRLIAGNGNSPSEVYDAAIDGSPNATCVIKLPKPSLLSANQFQEETSRLHRLNCHWIIRPIDSGEFAGRPFHVLPRLAGSLRGQLPVAPETFDTMAATLLSALHYLHADARLFHGDIKPDNLLLATLATPTGGQLHALVLTDLGSAMPIDQNGMGPAPWCLTPKYAPGAACQTRFRWDGRAELHCVAVTFCELLSGRVPERGRDGEVVADGCLRALESSTPAARRWGTLLDRAVSGEFRDTLVFYQAAERAGLLTREASAVFAEPPGWLQSGITNWFVKVGGGALAGLLTGLALDGGFDEDHILMDHTTDTFDLSDNSTHDNHEASIHEHDADHHDETSTGQDHWYDHFSDPHDPSDHSYEWDS